MNLTIFHQLNNLLFQNSVFDNTVHFLAVTFAYVVVAVSVIFLLVYQNDSRGTPWIFGLPKRVVRVLHVAAASVGTYIIGAILKQVIAHPRPFEYVEGVKVLFTDGGGDAFPSNHAGFFAALATVVYFHNKTAGVCFFVAAFLISISRVIGGVHFPIDILVGWVLGISIGLITNAIWKRFAKIV